MIKERVLEVKVSHDVVRQIAKVVSEVKMRILAAEGILLAEPVSNSLQKLRDSEREHFFEIIKMLLAIGFPGAKKTSYGFDFDFDELQKWLEK